MLWLKKQTQTVWTAEISSKESINPLFKRILWTLLTWMLLKLHLLALSCRGGIWFSSFHGLSPQEPLRLSISNRYFTNVTIYLIFVYQRWLEGVTKIPASPKPHLKQSQGLWIKLQPHQVRQTNNSYLKSSHWLQALTSQMITQAEADSESRSEKTVMNSHSLRLRVVKHTVA